jgi:hypothetical protein
MIGNDKMSRIQADADAGRIGGVIREIIKKKGGYSMEVIIYGDTCIKDPVKITDNATHFFGEWFERVEKDRVRDVTLAGIMETMEPEGFEAFATKLGVPDSSLEALGKGFEKKTITDEGRREGIELAEYVPTLEEFLNMIDRINPHSTGGISGLTYHMVQKWDIMVKTRVYEELKALYIKKEVPKG